MRMCKILEKEKKEKEDKIRKEYKDLKGCKSNDKKKSKGI